MRNVRELRESLADNYDQMRDKKMDCNLGKELANTAGKILHSVKIELEYNTYMGTKKRIEFLE